MVSNEYGSATLQQRVTRGCICRKPYVNVTRWFTTVINQPNVKAVIGEIVLCTKMAEFDAKKFAEFSGRAVQLCRMSRQRLYSRVRAS